MIMLNFDAGHYFGVTGLNPCDLIQRLHERILSIHIKDKTGPKAAEPNKNVEFGKGETPIKEILQSIKKIIGRFIAILNWNTIFRRVRMQ